MCGIVGAIARRNIVSFLIESLYRLKYRGCDSSGLAFINNSSNVFRIRKVGKVEKLEHEVKKNRLYGRVGIAHTRWATHGKPNEKNAHPHVSKNIAIVHNGIIENHEYLRSFLRKKKYLFTSDTDSEVIAHLIHWETNKSSCNLLEVVRKTILKLKGTYSLIVMDSKSPNSLVAVKSTSPLIIGLGINENFLASDIIALSSVSNKMIFLKNGDIAEVTPNNVYIFDKEGVPVSRNPVKLKLRNVFLKKKYKFYMKKEIHEQPNIINKIIEDRFLCKNKIFFDELNQKAKKILSFIEHVQIVACGTSYNAGMVGKYWFESLLGIPCDVEIASEYLYRKPAKRKNSLFVTLSQSGETIDTLKALKLSKKNGFLASLAICNVSHSSIVNESDFSIITKAGTELSIASTKSFTAQLTTILILVSYLNCLRSRNYKFAIEIYRSLKLLPEKIQKIFENEKIIKNLAREFFDKKNIIITGRGKQFPIAVEGALKMKEVSYIYAEAYAAGELKHGPLALIEKSSLAIVIAPFDELISKMKINIEELSSRGSSIYVLTDKELNFSNKKKIKFIFLPKVNEIVSPIFYIVPFQLLAYFMAKEKGLDVDHPRNLTKSVTVE
ncbi:glucosamine--fructose-6-phosphate aminotransferase [Candidatus Riesia sp. GBBU]|nr:glucosamine--fructose-6-phosphate aminotransferase [Candidatus Riesia sp. GBBU]